MQMCWIFAHFFYGRFAKNTTHNFGTTSEPATLNLKGCHATLPLKREIKKYQIYKVNCLFRIRSVREHEWHFLCAMFPRYWWNRQRRLKANENLNRDILHYFISTPTRFLLYSTIEFLLLAINSCFKHFELLEFIHVT